MKRLFSILLLLLLLSLSVKAQLLYKISGNGLANESYIIGTHHLTSITFLEDHVEGFQEAFDACDYVYGEILMDEQSLQKTQSLIQTVALMPKDTLYKDLVSADEYAFLDSQIKRYLGESASMDNLAMLKPAIISTTLAQVASSKTGEQIDPQKVMDLQLQRKASYNNMSVHGLETAEYQVEVLFGDPLQVQASTLIRSLKDNDLVEELKKLNALYKKQDLEALFNYAEESAKRGAKDDEELDTTMNKLLYKRNHNWSAQMPQILSKGATFIAVGAGHLGGKSGILSLLREQGYTVAPVK